MAKKIRVWDGSAWQDVAPALPYTAVHSAQASMPSTAVDGQIWLDTDASVPSTTVTRWYKLPSAGTTTLSGNDDNSIPLAYTPGYEQVFLNGTLLSRSAADYTATTGTSVVLSSAIVAGDIVEIICPLQITTTDTYTQSATNAAFQANTNNFAAGKNKIINGDFGIWQRATSTASATAGAYTTADRFKFWPTTGTTMAVSRQAFTNGASGIYGYEPQYYIRNVVASGNVAGTTGTMVQHVENVRTLDGQQFTFSFWAKADSTKRIGAEILQVFGTGGSSSVSTPLGYQTITTAWQRFTFTGTLPSINGKTITSDSSLEVTIWMDAGSSYNARSSSLGNQSGTFDIWGIQLEKGSNVTAFQTATGTIQGELAACQRYYWRAGGLNLYQRVGTGANTTGTAGYGIAVHPVTMRIAPTSIDFSTLGMYEYGGSAPISALVINQSGNTMTDFAYTTAGATQYRPVVINTQNSLSGYLGFSAEL